MARVVSVFSGKGGVGKTTVAINLGAAISHHLKKNVTLVDCNVTTSHLALHLGIYNSHLTLNNVLRDECDIEQAVYEHFSGMKIVPASLSLKDLRGIDMARLKDSLKGILHKNDIIMLDSSPGLGREAMASIGASDEVLYVTNPHIPSIMDIVRCQEVANEFGIASLGIILNMVNKDKHEITKDEAEHLTNLPVIASIPYDKNIRKSLAMKMPVVSYNPSFRVSRKFLDIASYLTGEDLVIKPGLKSSLKKLKFW